MATHPPAPSRFGVRARRLFDGTHLHDGGPVLVVVDEGTIQAVDLTGAAPSDELPVIDLGDCTLLPGLVDAHAHLVFDATAEAAAHAQEGAEATLLEQMHDAASVMLACGITTARDLGDRDYLSLVVRDRTHERADAGPTIVAAGPPLTPTGGHCWFLGGTADGVDALVAAVQEHASRGVDVIKVMVTGGRMTPTTRPHECQYSLDDIRAVVDTAHSVGLPVAAHVHARQGIVDALDAGVDTLEHVSFMTIDGIAPDQSVIDRIAARGTLASITIGQLPGVEVNPFMERAMPQIRAHLLTLAESGVRLALGPDSGIAPAKPHDVLPYAIVDAVDAGLTAGDALTAATSTSAEACGLADRAGRVARGRDADLLAVRGDPLADISAIHDVEAVFRRGTRAV